MFFIARHRAFNAATASFASRALHVSRVAATAKVIPTPADVAHSPDVYAKDDIDPTPPPPDSHVYRIDTTADTAQKPNEHILRGAKVGASYADMKRPEKRSGGAESEAYRHTTNNYTFEGGPGLRYGGKQELGKDQGPETSDSSESPNEGSKHGRK